MGYAFVAIKGISWLGLLRITTRTISFLKTAVLARLLTPAQFGFFAIASLVLSLTELVTETGINIVLVQRKEKIDHYINTAWVVSILRGFTIGLFILFSASLVANLFSMPQVLNLILLIASVPVIRGFINPARVKLVKDMRYRDEFFYNLSIFIVESVVTLILGYITRSASSIVFGLIAGSIVDVLLSFLVFRPTPKIRFKKELLWDIISRGKWLTATGIMSYLYQSIDNIAIGKILGASTLGLYDVLYKISLLPLTEVTDVVGKATFPVYVRINEDLARLKRAYLKSIFLIFVLSSGIGLFLFIFPELVISIVLGSQWLSGAPLLKILSIIGVLRAVYISIIHPLYALEKQSMVTVVFFLGLIVLVLTIVPFIIYWGVLGAAYSALLGTVFPLPLAFYFVNRELTKKK